MMSDSEKALYVATFQASLTSYLTTLVVPAKYVFNRAVLDANAVLALARAAEYKAQGVEERNSLPEYLQERDPGYGPRDVRVVNR